MHFNYVEDCGRFDYKRMKISEIANLLIYICTVCIYEYI